MSAVSFDVARAFSGPDYFADPYRTYAACLETRRYQAIPGHSGALGIFGHEDARALLAHGAVQAPRLRTFFPVPDLDLTEFKTLQQWVSRSIFHLQGDEHRSLRSIIERPFSQISIQRYESIIQETADARVALLADRTRLNAVDDIAAVLPTQVMGRLLGLPADAWETTRQAARAITYWTDGTHRSRRDTLAAHNSVDSLTGMLTLALARGDGPLLEALCARTIGTEVEIANILAQCVLCLVASESTLGNLIANALYLACAHPHVLTAIQNGELTVSALIDETLRFEAPVQFLQRTITADYLGEFGLIPAGTSVLICVGSAQRSASFVSDGTRFDPFRHQPALLSFGMTERTCIGRSLARLTATATVASLLAGRPALAPRGPVRWGRSFYFRGVAELTLEE